MKNVLKTTVAVIALSAVFAAPASAMVSQSDVARDISSVLGAGSSITVHENNGVITLTGHYADYGDEAAVLGVLNGTEGVDRVINLAFPSS